jgi:DedD protein
MGLFSLFNKNKQEATGGPYHSREDDEDAAIGARARSKRASSAGEPAARRGKEAAADPVLPEKKRARRRLVGAIALAVAVAVGLPMILDSEPKPLATDIDIRIPSKDKVAPQRAPVPVALADSLDRREMIVEAPKVVAPVAHAPAAPVAAEPRAVAEVKPAAVKPPELKKPESKPESKPEPKPESKPEQKMADKPAAKPAAPDAERALAILEDKPAAAPANQKYIVQVAALSSQEKVNELQGKLKAAGIPHFTQKGTGKSGELIRVRVGPFSKEEGETIRAKLSKLGLSGSVVPNS